MVTWLAPAKINLFLHVIGRRADGYHLLQTVFQFIDIYDELSFEVRPDGQIRRVRALEGIDEDQDLSILAARYLKEHTGCSLGVDICIEKRIPSGAGLGGGSSNAATTLLALNQLWHLNLDRGALSRIALKLGADVPVFVNGHNAWAQGIGEELTPLSLDQDDFVVIVPRVHVSTAEIFANPKLTRMAKPITIRDFRAGLGLNHLQPVTCELYPQVQQALDWLSAQSPAVETGSDSTRYASRMSGSGAAVFRRTRTMQAAKDMVESCPVQWQAFFARGLLKHPHG